MISKELFAIKFETDDKIGSGFLLREMNSMLLICKGAMLQDEFRLIIGECLRQIKKNRVRACIADFGLMNTELNACHVKKDFHENISAAGITRLAIVLPVNSINGEFVQNARETRIQHPDSLVAFYSYSFSDALLWMTDKSRRPLSYQSVKGLISSITGRLKFTINSAIG
ncbi:hypothetical protein LVD17_09585 [Fulvivirga ulvae]|uniref:hypothetical protein n=1 Tax=Fulvivirga ulvae TaxID=2904245 RepID=UPI001F48A9F2|nr:hypothetical protein [Fulvivirga ulvae]UII34064.1 hypothetical protein LVD17_09585 [Fulvivirga ulvae]